MSDYDIIKVEIPEYEGILIFRFKTDDRSSASPTKRTLPSVAVDDLETRKLLALTRGGAE